ncbi:hypothetical protein ABW19_dt0210450 [Dactylella cylindrospora]|nr:hypothetical protein ABW19_dt0210450 [Dactylella cylindrospora]
MMRRTFLRPLASGPYAVRSFHANRSLSEGLKVLFCGSDQVSLQSLKTLANLKSEGGYIESLDVLIKQEKPSGRGMKERRLNPVQEFAESNELTLHKIETFRGWKFSHPIDLIVAVSFGLFIPARLIEEATYGGLNVHPSFLPKYRGSAPIHHALLNGDKATGVVLQTLDKQRFDNGKILSKSHAISTGIDPTKFTPPPSDPLSIYRTLEYNLAVEGSKLLAEAIKAKLYDPEVHSSLAPIETGETESLASRSKVSTAAGKIKFKESTAQDLFHKSLALGSLWCYKHNLENQREKPKRAILGPIRLPTPKEKKKYLDRADRKTQFLHIPSERPERSVEGYDPGCVALRVGNNEWILVKNIKIEGKEWRDAEWWMQVLSPDKTRFGDEFDA